LKGKSLTAFETALEDVRVDPDPNIQAPLPLTLDHIIDSMDQVDEAVFPHRTLEIQELWMNQGMRKPLDMSTRKTAAAITKINNSVLLFPDGTNGSKFTDQELVQANGIFPRIVARSSTLRAMSPLSEQRRSSSQNAKQLSVMKPSTRSAKRQMTTITTTRKTKVRQIRCKSSKKWPQQ
jgi:hypothetical protein